MIPPLLAALLVTAPAPGPAGPVRVERVEVEGARRTDPDLVRSALGLAPGDLLDPARLPALEQRVLNQRIFRSVRVVAEPGPAGAVVRATVDEKLTLVPLPILGASRGVVTAGAALLESNLLGAGKQLMGGVVGSSRGVSAFALYRDPGVGYGPWLLSADAAAADARRERYQGRDLAYRYRERRLELSALGGRRLGGGWAAQAGWFERRGEAWRSPGQEAPPRDGPVHGPAVELSLDALDYDLWLPRGATARAALRQGLALSARDREPRQAAASAGWAGAAGPRLALSAAAALEHVRGDPILDALRLGGRPGSRGFVSQGLWAEDAATLALEAQVPIARPRLGVITAAALLDAGAVRWRGQATRYLAPGVGLRVYLRDVAIPVLGFDLAWAIGEEAPAASVQLGFGGRR